MKFETVRIHFLSDVFGLLSFRNWHGNSWQRDVTTLSLLSISNEFKIIFPEQLGTVLSYTNVARGSAVCTQSTLMVKVLLMCSVIKKQPEGGGQCSRRDWTARLISIVTEMTTKMGSVTWMASSGLDWTRFTAWPIKNATGFELI